jgi:hypothetical protein
MEKKLITNEEVLSRIEHSEKYLKQIASNTNGIWWGLLAMHVLVIILILLQWKRQEHLCKLLVKITEGQTNKHMKKTYIIILVLVLVVLLFKTYNTLAPRFRQANEAPNTEVPNAKDQYEEALAKNLANKETSEKIVTEIVGEWYDDRPYVEGKYTITKVKDRYYLKREFKDGSGGTGVLNFSTQNGKSKFSNPNSSQIDYYVIDKNGNLGSYDNQGYINTMRSLK